MCLRTVGNTLEHKQLVRFGKFNTCSRAICHLQTLTLLTFADKHKHTNMYCANFLSFLLSFLFFFSFLFFLFLFADSLVHPFFNRNSVSPFRFGPHKWWYGNVNLNVTVNLIPHRKGQLAQAQHRKRTTPQLGSEERTEIGRKPS